MSTLNTDRFVHTVVKVIQKSTMAELSSQGYKLVMNYMNEAADQEFSVCARYAIQKYTGNPVPTLEEIRERNKTSGITPLDDLILQMEYEAARLEKIRER